MRAAGRAGGTIGTCGATGTIGAIGTIGTLLALAGTLAVLAASTAGCAAASRWLDRRKADRPPWRTVKPAVAAEIVRDTPSVFVLDLRPPEEFQGPYGHLLGAVNIPLGQLPYRLLELRVYRPDTFLVYCDADACGTTGMAALVNAGFHQAILIGGGVYDWIRGGYPTYVRTDTHPPPNARIKVTKHPEMVPERLRPKYEAPVIPPPVPAPVASGATSGTSAPATFGASGAAAQSTHSMESL